jgi:hypothetical protein
MPSLNRPVIRPEFAGNEVEAALALVEPDDAVEVEL